MSKKRIHEIANDFNKFEDLRTLKKYTSEKIISLDRKKPSRNDIKYSETSVKHSTIQEEITLIVEAKVVNNESFKFQLRCKSFIEMPYFRFDSDGLAHKNLNPEIPLKEQIVTTPHFNSFDKEGRSIAYKSEKLNIPSEANALKDINLCFIHFCFECNLRYPEDEFSEINTIPTGELSLQTTGDDPLLNINFHS